MKITKTQLRQIIKEEMDSFEVLGKLIRIRQRVRDAMVAKYKPDVEEIYKSLDEDLSLIIKALPGLLSK
jgi:hypothetical protein|tara:strand:- start:16 stop:222 length:207 start_codon:yes stop_codon:yes gene_type:complete